MKADLKVKYLQYLHQKKQDEGFTLIELLVVIIIIGILAAIALPSFLSQANKAKQSEAKTYVGSLNKGQQAYYTEKGIFGTDISSLGIGIKTQTNNYAYYTSLSGTGTGANAISLALLTSQAPSAIKTYAGVVFLQEGGASSDATSIAILCETKTPGAIPGITGTGNYTACPTATMVPVGQ